MAEERKEAKKDVREIDKKGKKRFSIENLKKADIKHLAKVFTLIWGLVLIVLMTITNVGLERNFDWITWLSNSLIIFGIMVFGLFMGETSGQDKQMQKEGGLYQEALQKYNTYNESISSELIHFNQFYSWLLPQELKQKKLDYLIANDVDPVKAQKIIKHCSKSDLDALCEHIFEITDEHGNVIDGIRKLEEHEIEPVRDVLSGVIRLNAASANYFLTAFADSRVNHRMVEEGKFLQRERGRNKKFNRTIKIVSSLGISLVWGLLTVYDFISGDDTQAWVNLISRITALFTSFFSGWLSSVVDVKLQARILENKYKVLKLFHECLEQKLFDPRTEEQIIRDELKKYKEKKEQDAKMFVVHPTTDNIAQIDYQEPIILPVIEKEGE